MNHCGLEIPDPIFSYLGKFNLPFSLLASSASTYFTEVM